MRRTFASFTDDIDCAGDGIGAVERALRAARHFDVVHTICRHGSEIEIAAEQIYLDTVDHHQVVVRIAAANKNAGRATVPATLIDCCVTTLTEDPIWGASAPPIAAETTTRSSSALSFRCRSAVTVSPGKSCNSLERVENPDMLSTRENFPAAKPSKRYSPPAPVSRSSTGVNPESKLTRAPETVRPSGSNTLPRSSAFSVGFRMPVDCL